MPASSAGDAAEPERDGRRGATQRGGRRRKFYALRPAGITAMRHAYHAFRSMADGLEGQLEPK